MKKEIYKDDNIERLNDLVNDENHTLESLTKLRLRIGYLYVRDILGHSDVEDLSII